MWVIGYSLLRELREQGSFKEGCRGGCGGEGGCDLHKGVEGAGIRGRCGARG